MKKYITLAAILFLFISVTPALANVPAGPAAYNGLAKGNSAVHHLELYEKDSGWNIVHPGAWGKMTFNTNMDTFVLSARGLMPNTEYALIHYMGWPDGHILARGYTNNGGNLNLSGSWSYWAGKFWVVKGSDISGNVGDEGEFSAWNPSMYLFEYNIFDFE